VAASAEVVACFHSVGDKKHGTPQPSGKIKKFVLRQGLRDAQEVSG